ncbi:MAG: hypothetical protein JRD05_12800 [Deltaproteobacteria bacterium]|nr:hypothetical protein [Deltaproteobacteria bacterium]
MTKSITDRDIEREREELLKLMESSITPEIMESIEFGASLIPENEIIPVKISNKGAFDAIEE